jgi:hypothetical protein
MIRIDSSGSLMRHIVPSIQAWFTPSTKAAPMNRLLRTTTLATIALLSLCLTLGGCGLGVTTSTTSAPTGSTGPALHGLVYGGQQPLYGAAVYLYAAGTSDYGSTYPYPGAAKSLLGSNVVTTDQDGGFNLGGDYSCPTPATEVYLEAVGGSPDGVLADNNPNVIMLAALGPCGNLSSATFITLNELTTVASVWSLAPFMTGPSNIGTRANNLVGLANAFETVNTLVNIQYGQVNSTSLPAGATVPTAELNTLADILAACVNTPKGGHSGDSTQCGALFQNAIPPGGSAPTDTLTAALNIAHYPGQNVQSLALIANKTAPFQNIEASIPTDWTISIRYTAGGALAAPSGVAADQAGNIWVANSTGASVTRLSTVGDVVATYTGGSGPLAIDLSGDLWINGSTPNSLLEISSAGVTSSSTGGGLGTTTAIAVDGSGYVWAAGTGTTLSQFNSANGTAVAASGFTGGGLSNARSIAITPK